MSSLTAMPLGVILVPLGVILGRVSTSLHLSERVTRVTSFTAATLAVAPDAAGRRHGRCGHRG